MDEPSTTHLWWQYGIIYQIYPRSFLDTDGDGVGDLAGIQERLDYLEWLGIDAVWISPIYPSPMADFGYDVADYTDIHPLFGTMEDFDELLEEVHRRDMKLILDLVPNHTSEEHPWFKESRASRENPKRDWYIWRDAQPDGSPPNNWLSVFGGSGWTWDEKTEQYYYHAFLQEQPDLNWRNPDVQEAMYDAMRFWLDKGVDGFRIDVLWHLIKDEQFRDNPPNPAYKHGLPTYDSLQPTYSADRPEIHDITGRMRGLVNDYDERVLIGEIYLPVERLITYYGDEGAGVHLPFNFQLIELPWDARKIGAAISEYEGMLPPEAWPNWVLGNHDKSRIATRVGAAQARVAAMLLLTLRGTPTMYYGDELGMHDVDVPDEQIQDPRAVREAVPGMSRDPERTPMQWDSSPNAGFTEGEPWLPIADDHETVNVAAERDDPQAMLTLYRRLISLRRKEEALATGSYTPVTQSSDDVLAYVRTGSDQSHRFFVALNMSGEAQQLPMAGRSGSILLTTMLDRQGEMAEDELSLRPDEGILIRLSQHTTGGTE